jgi:hypothetical protein
MHRAAAAKSTKRTTKKPAPKATANPNRIAAGGAKGSPKARGFGDPNRVEFDGAKVALHLVDEASGSYLLHLEVLHPDLGHIVLPREASFAGGIEGHHFTVAPGGRLGNAFAHDLAVRDDHSADGRVWGGRGRRVMGEVEGALHELARSLVVAQDRHRGAIIAWTHDDTGARTSRPQRQD